MWRRSNSGLLTGVISLFLCKLSWDLKVTIQSANTKCERVMTNYNYSLHFPIFLRSLLSGAVNSVISEQFVLLSSTSETIFCVFYDFTKFFFSRFTKFCFPNVFPKFSRNDAIHHKVSQSDHQFFWSPKIQLRLVQQVNLAVYDSCENSGLLR